MLHRESYRVNYLKYIPLQGRTSNVLSALPEFTYLPTGKNVKVDTVWNLVAMKCFTDHRRSSMKIRSRLKVSHKIMGLKYLFLDYYFTI